MRTVLALIITAVAGLGFAADLYARRCASCHGEDGLGDGPAAAALDPKPASFADPAWQRGIEDEGIDRAIVEGGAALGKSPLMPPNPDLADDPDTVAAIRELIRGMVGEEDGGG